MESVQATAEVESGPAEVFAVVTDPTRHASIDGTGWVTDAVDPEPLRRVGQLFRMAMYHPEHPDGAYETVNEVTVLDPPRAVAWRTGYVDDSRTPVYGGWWWRYDLEPLPDGRTRTTLTYDWSEVGPGPREHLTFPPFAPSHLTDSLRRLRDLVTVDP